MPLTVGLANIRVRGGGRRSTCSFVYNESIKRDLKIRLIHEYRYDERLKTKNDESTLLSRVVYYESIKRDLKIRCIYECRCDERLQTKTEEFTCLTDTGFVCLL